eukprot:CAMPEP_0119049910 /NCGR_PEP_ID=MMETSP1177-20130426/67155_1 /TAXON_ID=2985 /ORGANISM="Ochromonas sp, Strain CCMP1899" /LENGTH=686 /DNA_ID=CAMNT_0007027707 /DNA_START=174 /DNA_END=2231 /DNA_ORIENTATION=-
MAVVGIDFGNLSTLIGQAGRGGVDVILNDSSNRQTASYVSILGKQRFLGDSGAAMSRSNIANTFSCMKLLVGRKFNTPEVQKELRRAPFKTAELSNGGVGFMVHYENKDTLISAEHVMAMVLVKAKEVVSTANKQVGIADAVIAVPHWFSEAQRRGVSNACEIANIKCLKCANENTLVALSYGIFKSAKNLFDAKAAIHVMFIDIGYTGYSVTVVDFVQENMKVLATAVDRSVGGRDFDDVIIEFMAEVFERKTAINVRTDHKANLKLQAAAEKAKKTLSPNGVSEVAVNVECLADDQDLSVILTKSEFEKRSAYLIDRLEEPVRSCLRDTLLTAADLSDVEIVGGSSRISIVKRRLGEILELDKNAVNYGLKTTMNSDEAVARGGALQCAMLSAQMRVKPFNVIDIVPFSYLVNGVGDDGRGQSILFNKGDKFPLDKSLRWTLVNKTRDFVLTVDYKDMNGVEKEVSKFTIKMPTTSSPKNVRVSFNLDKNHFLILEKAEIVEESLAENVRGEINKKKKKYTDLVVITESFGLNRAQITQSIAMEKVMETADNYIIETADKRNELETYLYSMRDKLDAELKLYSSSNEKEKLKNLMNEAEGWLYGAGFDSTKQQYKGKIDGLKVLSDPIESRLSEDQQRGPLIETLEKSIDSCRKFADSRDPLNSHITDSERKQLRDAATKSRTW